MPLDLEPVEEIGGLDLEYVPEPSRQISIPEPGVAQPTLRAPQTIQNPVQAFPATESRIEALRAAQTPELSLEEAEQILTTPNVSIPRFGEPGTVTRGVSELASGLVEQAALTPAAPLMNLALAVPGVRIAAGTLMSAAAAKAGAQQLGEASVTGNAQTMTEGIGMTALAAIGGLGVAGDAIARLAPRTMEAVGKPSEAPKVAESTPKVEPTPEPLAVEPVVEAAAAAPETPKAAASVPLMVTREMEQSLADLGYTKEQRNQMTPAQAQEILSGTKSQTAQPEIIGMGGAVPSEFEPVSKTATGIKNATVERERAARGLPPAVEPARRDFGRVWDEAMAKIDQDPAAQDKLIAELREKPRALTDTEDAILLQRQIDLQNEYGKATRDLAQAYDDGRMDAVAQEKARVADLSNRLFDLYEIDKKAGTETGRGLSARRMMANEDFTLAKMEMDARESKGGAPLTDAERADMTQKANEFQRINQELEAKLAEKERLLSDAQLARTTAEMQAAAAKQPAIPPQIKRIVERVGEILDTRANAARARLRGKLFTLSPELLKDLAEVGAANIYHIGVDLAKWSAKMIEDIGEHVKPHLQTIWEASQKLIDGVTDAAAGKVEPVVRQVRATIKSNETPAGRKEKIKATIRESVGAGEEPSRTMIQKLAREFVEDGTTDRDVLVDQVHEAISGIAPKFTRKQTADAISGYGDAKLLRKDEVSVRLRDLKGQLQQIAKLEDMQAGKAPLKSGLERRTPSDIEKELIALVNEAKKKGGYQTTDPNTQLRSALDEVKARMNTEIKKLLKKMVDKDFSKPTKREIQLDKEALDLQFRREMVKREWHAKLLENKLANESAVQKVFRSVGEVINLARAIMTSLDFSGVLRQGGISTMAHPIRSAKSIPAMLRSFVSKRDTFKIDQEIMQRPNAPLYKRSGLYLSEHGVPLSKMEEAYMSRWAEKVPLVAGSQRAYTTFLNKLRADSFDAFAKAWGKDGHLTPDEAKVIANYINESTGRGSIGIHGGTAAGLNTLFFAPRFVASRLQMLVGHPIYYGFLSGKVPFRGTGRVRAMIAADMARSLAGYGVLFGLAYAAGFKIGLDPNSSDFGKIVMGNTRIDFLAGLQQIAVFLSREISGKRTNLKGKTVPIRGKKVPYGGKRSLDVAVDFGRSKLAPVPAAVVDAFQGEDIIGREVTPLSTIKRFAPISSQELLPLIEDQGVPKATALEIINLLGASVNTYGPRKK